MRDLLYFIDKPTFIKPDDLKTLCVWQPLFIRSIKEDKFGKEIVLKILFYGFHINFLHQQIYTHENYSKFLHNEHLINLCEVLGIDSIPKDADEKNSEAGKLIWGRFRRSLIVSGRVDVVQFAEDEPRDNWFPKSSKIPRLKI